MKARISQNTNYYSNKNFSEFSQPKYNDSYVSSPNIKIIPNKRQTIEENENTLTISEKEGVKDNKDEIQSSSRNLQQILDKLDENSGFISLESSNMTGLKIKETNGEKDHELESPFQESKALSNVQPNIKTNFSPLKKGGKSNEITEHSKSQSPRSVRSNKSIGSPTKVNGKKEFLSFFDKKGSRDSEFTRENVKQHNKNSSNFDKLLCLQTIEDEKKLQETNAKKTKNVSPIWVAKFSPDYKYLATGGSDGVFRVYLVRIMQERNFGDELEETDLQILNPESINFFSHKFDIIDISWYKVIFLFVSLFEIEGF